MAESVCLLQHSLLQKVLVICIVASLHLLCIYEVIVTVSLELYLLKVLDRLIERYLEDPCVLVFQRVTRGDGKSLSINGELMLSLMIKHVIESATALRELLHCNLLLI